MAGALSSEERVVAQLEQSSSRAETIAEVRPRDANSMLADLAEALFAIADVNDGLDLAEANQCLFEGELLLIRPDILTANALDNPRIRGSFQPKDDERMVDARLER